VTGTRERGCGSEHALTVQGASCLTCLHTEALDYLATRLAAAFKLELGAPQQQRRALAQLVKPLGPLVQQPGQDEA
jgi:hypothetical protein